MLKITIFRGGSTRDRSGKTSRIMDKTRKVKAQNFFTELPIDIIIASLLKYYTRQFSSLQEL